MKTIFRTIATNLCLLLGSVGLSQVQTQINPNNQIQWNAVSGCNTPGYVYVPADLQCEPNGGGSGTVAKPVDSPGAGTYTSTQTVTLTDSTGSAVICYRTDGGIATSPVAGSCGAGSTIYSSPFSIISTSTVSAIGTLSGYASSSLLTSVYTISESTLATPTFSPTPGTYSSTQSVSISFPTGAILCVTGTSTPPTAPTPGTCGSGSSTYSGSSPLVGTVSSTNYLLALATESGFVNSAVGGGLYTITGGAAATPTASPAAGTYSSAQSVTLSTTTGGATICYTTDGSTPLASTPGTCSHGTTYSSAVTVASSLTINAIATESGFVNSGLLTAGYTISGSASSPSFSPSPGTYASSQTVTITCPSGKSAWYTTDGSAPTIASTLYSSPVTVSSTTTLNAICATKGAVQQDIQASSTGSECHVGPSPPPSTTTYGSLTCTNSGGVGSIAATNVTWTFGTPSAETVTAPSGAGSETQVLYTWLFGGSADPSASTCDSCTEEVQDIWVEPTAGNTIIANNEMDMPQYDHTHGVNRQNGLQCNQQSGKLRWEVDSGNAGGWTGTGIACNLAANTWYHVILKVHWVLGDTGCGGNGCAHYDMLCVNGTCNTLGGTYGNTQGYSSTSNKAWGRQDQIDLKPNSSSVTGGRNVKNVNVSLGYYGGESPVTSGIYTISSALATPTASPAAGTYSSTQSVTLTLPSGATGCYTTSGSTPTAPTAGTCGSGSTTYSGAISISSTTTLKAISTKSGFVNSSVFSGTYTISGGGSTVATPVFSTGSGSVSAGTSITASTSTSGATIYYTTTIDGTTPPDPSYDSSTYMPAANSTTFIYGTAGTSGITAGNSFVSGFNIYGPMKIKMLAAKSGMTDSSIASASYTLNAPSGTVITTCGMLPSAAGTYYLTGNLTCPGTGLQFGGDNQVINLNGNSLTYGTDNGTILSGTDLTTTSSGTTVSCSSCTFTSGMVGDIMLIDDYNQGGYTNNGTLAQAAPKIATFTDSHHVILSSAPGFAVTNGEYGVYSLPVYGVLCNLVSGVGADCTNGEVINGTITQGANAPPYSWAISMQPQSFNSPAHGGNTFANLTFNISGIEAEAVQDLDGAGGDKILNNVVNDSVTQIYYRDGLPYPINLDGNQPGVSSPVDSVHDNKVYGSPQGGVYAYWTANVINNYFDANGTVQYANGFGAFLAADDTVVRGNSINGFTQGIEEQASNTTMQNNYISIVMQDPVQDPNHNLPQCELGYGFREKDFGGGGNPLGTGSAANGTPLVSNVLKANVFNDDSGTCGVNDVEFSLTYGDDTTAVDDNILSLNMSTNSTVNPSEIYGIDETNATGITYSGNTNTISGSFASDGYAAYVNFDQVINWTMPLTGLTNPAIAWRQGNSGINTTATFTGSGTPTCTKIPNSGSTSSWTATFNGSSLLCP